MTLANMRENGVRSSWVAGPLCHHNAVVNVDSFGPDVAVPAFGPRMVCTGCGIIDVPELAGATGAREHYRNAVALSGAGRVLTGPDAGAAGITGRASPRRDHATETEGWSHPHAIKER